VANVLAASMCCDKLFEFDPFVFEEFASDMLEMEDRLLLLELLELLNAVVKEITLVPFDLVAESGSRYFDFSSLDITK
jgi:hypothetical protein